LESFIHGACPNLSIYSGQALERFCRGYDDLQLFFTSCLLQITSETLAPAGATKKGVLELLLYKDRLGLLDGVSAMAAALYLFYGFRIFKIDKML